MKYVPRPLPVAAADASRGHDRHPLRELAFLVAIIGLFCLAGYLVVSLATDAVVRRISPATEARLFAALGESLPQPKPLAEELVRRQELAEGLLERMRPHAHLETVPVRLIIWDRPETNAVALPGGTIALTTGLLRCLEDEQGMAFVLAHELGHFHARDHLRGLGRQVGFRAVLAVVFSGSSDLQLGASQAGQLALLSHSREREMAADRFAMQLMLDTFGKDEGATRLFEQMGDSGLPGWAYMFDTHPATQERIEALKQQARQAANEGKR